MNIIAPLRLSSGAGRVASRRVKCGRDFTYSRSFGTRQLSRLAARSTYQAQNTSANHTLMGLTVVSDIPKMVQRRMIGNTSINGVSASASGIHRAYVALGSNVGNRLEMIEKACRALDEDPDISITRTSSLYETDPMYVEDQGRFLNGACEVRLTLTW